MNKFFIISLLLAVALAATAPKTDAKCFAALGATCKVCKVAKKDSAKCKKAVKKATNILCIGLHDCYEDVKKAAAKKVKQAQRKLSQTYSKLCPTDKSQCVDKSPNCPAWAANSPSDCRSNPDWMLPNCARSCCPLCTPGQNRLNPGVCPPKKREDLCVQNADASCHAWAKNKECAKNPKFMKVSCMQSCCNTCKFDTNKCPTVRAACVNKYAKPNKAKGNKSCIAWAQNGECTSNPTWMNSNCAKQCCSVCRAAPPGQAQAQLLQPRQPVYQQPRQVVYGGYSTAGLPYYGR